MNEWMATIRRGRNGYVVEYDDADEETPVQVMVYEDKDTGSETRDLQLSTQEMFYDIMEHFAVFNNKHDNNGKGQYMRIEVDE